ncbi:hypothetical protein D3C80_1710790 [compost metagenome]
MFNDRLTGHHAVDAAILHRNGAVDHQHVFPFVLLNRAVLVFFRLFAERSREDFVVFHGNHVKQQVLDRWVSGP